MSFRSPRRRWAVAALLAGVLATGSLGAPAAQADLDEVGDFLFAVDEQTTLPGGLTVENEDVVRFHGADDTFSLAFDGSDVGLSGFSIDALAELPLFVVPGPPGPGPGPGPGPIIVPPMVRSPFSRIW